VHIASEETKFGFSFNEVDQLFKDEEFIELGNVLIVGLMGMATNTPNQEIIRNEFRGLKAFFEHLKTVQASGNVAMKELSMGMSSDYAIALEEGSTMVRVGSAIFGNRHYA
jgi:uncharacterized pyridoxal phosphate-containing UPF0001 family protein